MHACKVFQIHVREVIAHVCVSPSSILLCVYYPKEHDCMCYVDHFSLALKVFTYTYVDI